MTLDLNALPSIHGRRFGVTKAGHLVADGRIMETSWRDRGGQAVISDHFLGQSMNNLYWKITLKGSDGSAAVPAIVASNAGGASILTSGAGATLTMAVNGSELVGGALNFDVAKGHMELAASVQMSRITNACVFIGFADSLALAMPFTISGTTLTANATNGHGLLFDTAATAATWKVVGVANGVAAAIIDTGVAPVAATYDLIRTEIDLNGNLTAFLNDLPVAASAAGYGYATAGGVMAPTFSMFSRVATSYTAQADFIYAAQDR